jgi:hypothetical protein
LNEQISTAVVLCRSDYKLKIRSAAPRLNMSFNHYLGDTMTLEEQAQIAALDNWLYSRAVETYDKPIILKDGPALEWIKQFEPNFIGIEELNNSWRITKRIAPKR